MAMRKSRSAPWWRVAGRGKAMVMETPLPVASAADVLRALTKDHEYVDLIDTSLSELLRRTLPPRVLSQPLTRNVASKLTRLAYFVFTRAAPLYATPGEQYASVVPVAVHRARRHVTLVGRARMLFVALMHIWSTTELLNIVAAAWNRLCPSISFPRALLERLFESALRLHLALFYLRGRYACVPTRLGGVRYLATANLMSEDALLPFLGVIMMLMLLSQTCTAIYAVLKRYRAGGLSELRGSLFSPTSVEEKELVPGRPTCILCMGSIQDATLTTCGHVFCWNCICHWCSSNEVCPLCRQQVLVRKLVCLYNY